MADTVRKATKSKTPKNIATLTAIDRAVEEEKRKFGTEYYSCYLCGNVYKKIGFHKCTDFKSLTGVSRVCKQCVEKIVYDIKSDGKKNPPTRESIQQALEYLDKPWFLDVYEASLSETENVVAKASAAKRKDVWTAYIKNISLPQYNGLRWKDGDILTSASPRLSDVRDTEAKEIQDMYEVNKRTVLKAVGYDPFETANESDKPLMYSKLCGFLDESTNEDEMKLGACIEITQSFNQAERLNFVINALEQTAESTIRNAAQIKTLEDTKNKIYNSALNLAKDNGISARHSNNNSKGANTWTGKVKELKEINLRSAELNAYDIDTAQGMQQVADISAKAIAKQLDFDENDYADIIKSQRSMIEDLQKKVDEHSEEYRLLKRENQDLKSFLRSKNMINERDEVVV